MTEEEAKQMLKSYAGMTNKLTDNQGRPKLDQAIETVLKALEDSIPKEKVRELIKSYTHDMELCDDTDMFEAVESEMYEYGIDMLKELLGE